MDYIAYLGSFVLQPRVTIVVFFYLTNYYYKNCGRSISWIIAFCSRLSQNNDQSLTRGLRRKKIQGVQLRDSFVFPMREGVIRL